MDVIALDGELDQAKAEAVVAGPECADDGREAGAAAKVGRAGEDFQGDVNREARRERRAGTVTAVLAGRLALAAGVVAQAAAVPPRGEGATPARTPKTPR